jgi:hypothetical protein
MHTPTLETYYDIQTLNQITDNNIAAGSQRLKPNTTSFEEADIPESSLSLDIDNEESLEEEEYWDELNRTGYVTAMTRDEMNMLRLGM